MELNEFNDRRQLVHDLHHHVAPIIDSLSYDADLDDINDWVALLRLSDRLVVLDKLLIVEYRFSGALFIDMEVMKTSEEDSKWTFPMEKEFNYFVRDCLLSWIDGLVDFSRERKFIDYRARDFQRELQQKMEMLRDWYKERYDL